MNEISMNVFFVVITVGLVPLLIYLFNALKVYKDERLLAVDNAMIRKYVDDAVAIIENVVISTTQTYVDNLKKSGAFGQEEHKIAFQKSKTTALKLITEEAQTFITKLYGDFNTWLDVQIEVAVGTKSK